MLPFLWLLLWYSYSVLAMKGDKITATIDYSKPVHTVDEEFVSVAIDWAKIMGFMEHGRWHTKIDLKNPYLGNLLRELNNIQPVHLRLGGGAGECIYYMNETMKEYISQYCLGKRTKGVVDEQYLKEILEFTEFTGVDLVWGLNAAYKRGFKLRYHPWDPKNAEDLMKYLVEHEKERLVFAWELGNEPNNEKFGFLINGKDYANDFNILHNSISKIYGESTFQPEVHGPDTCQSSHVSAKWISDFKKGTESFISGYAYHFYLGGHDIPIADILNATLLIQRTETESQKWETANNIPIWLGEGTVVSQGGVPGISDAFAGSLWYAGELGVLAALGNRVYIRQEFVGADYGMLNYTNYQPLPDYFLAVMWKRVMGTDVFETTLSSSFQMDNVIAFAHSAHSPRFNLSVAIVNFSKESQLIELNISGISKPFTVQQEQYHLTADNLDSHEIKVNGVVAKVGDGKDPYVLPTFRPIMKQGCSVEVEGYSIVFVNVKLIL